MSGIPSEGVGGAFGLGFVDPNFVASIVFERGSKVPTFDGVWCPGATNGWFFVDENFRAGRSERGTVVVKGAM